jgi:hypothetical protein
MPRTRRRQVGSVRDGVRVPGIYPDLLRRGREKRCGRKCFVDPNDPSAGFFQRSTHRLDALEAGETVTVAAWELGSRRVPVPESLHPRNCKVCRVSPDDSVVPARAWGAVTDGRL